MKIKTLLLCTAMVALGAPVAHSASSGPAPSNLKERSVDAQLYEEYERREPCQYYRLAPSGHYTGNCMAESYVVEASVQTTAPVPTQRLLPVIQSYTILFDFDESEIRSNENRTIDTIIREVGRYNPEQITVTGYTDSSGKSDYNQTLSREREQAVSRALLSHGVANQTLDRKARGEYSQAVKTADDTKNQENRRVVVDFRQ